MAEYSPSQLDKFKQCPRQYKFIYVDRIRRKDEGVEAFVGQRFHDAMEWLYAERAFRCAPLDELLDYYERDWAARWHADVKIKKRERSQDDYRLMCRSFIESYYRRHHPFDQGKVLGLEYDVRFPLDEAGRYRCKGRIDRIMIAPDGVFEVHDYKTSSTLPAQSKLDEDWQLALYQLGIQTIWPQARDVRLVWHHVAFDLEMRSARTPEALAKLKSDVAAFIDRVEAEQDFPVRESALCDWCAYWDLCPAKKHLVKVEALPADTRRDEPGVAIADAYVEKWRRRKELEAETKAVKDEMDVLRKAAIEFAERESVQVIGGTRSRIKVMGKDRLFAPAKGTEERRALEAELKRLGVWDEVADVDRTAVEKAVAKEEWGPDATAALREYFRAEKTWTLTVKEEDEDPEA